MTDLYDRQWDKLVLRLKSRAATLGESPGWLNVSLLIVDGCLQYWAAPQVQPLEPSRSDTSALLDALQEDG